MKEVKLNKKVKIVYDRTKPNGTPRKVLDISLAKRYGWQRAVTMINTITYKSLITDLGIDVVVDPRAITVSSVMRHVRRGKIRSIYSLGEGVGESIALEALEPAPIIGQGIKDIKLKFLKRLWKK